MSWSLCPSDELRSSAINADLSETTTMIKATVLELYDELTSNCTDKSLKAAHEKTFLQQVQYMMESILSYYQLKS